MSTYTPPATNNSDQGLRLAAFIVNLLSLLLIVYGAFSSSGVTLIALAWMIPMTVISGGIYKGTKRNTTNFGVCTLLFMSIISGILLLMSTKDQQP